MLKFRVVGQRLIWENPDEVIVADTKKYLECYFEFDGDAWRGYKLIDAYFKKGRDNPIRMVLSANRIWREDGLCLSAGEWSLYLCATEYATRTNADGSTESIVDRQITSSVVTIKVLASGQMTNAENSFKSPEIADQYIAQMLDAEKGEKARSVFEEYNENKTYVYGNKVAYDGSSYTLKVESAKGVLPTDEDTWLCIARRGNDMLCEKYSLVSTDFIIKDSELKIYETSYYVGNPGGMEFKNTDIFVYQPSLSAAPYIRGAYFQPVDAFGDGRNTAIEYKIYTTKNLGAWADMGYVAVMRNA